MDAVELWLERRKSSPKPDDDFLIRLEELHIPIQHTAPTPQPLQA